MAKTCYLSEILASVIEVFSLVFSVSIQGPIHFLCTSPKSLNACHECMILMELFSIEFLTYIFHIQSSQ